MRAPLDGLDLNLLLTLHTLLEEGSVTRAAQRLGKSQPTVSRALADLRASFDDPLLVRSGRGLTPTPFALALRAPLAQSLVSLDHLRTVGDFDPTTDSRHFRLLVPDLVGGILIADLLERTQNAPSVSFEVHGSEMDALGSLLRREVDLVISAAPADHPEMYARRLDGAGIGWSTVVGPAHPGYGGEVTLEAWLRSHHLQVLPGGRPDVPSHLDQVLRERGLRRFVRAQVTYVSAVAPAVMESKLVASLPTPVARWLAAGNELEVHPHPLSEALGRLPIYAGWHAGDHTDAGHRWLRGLIEQCIAAFVAG